MEPISHSPYSTGIDFKRQNLTSVDVKLWRLKSIPVSSNTFIMAVDHNKDINDDFKLKKLFDLHCLYKIISAL